MKDKTHDSLLPPMAMQRAGILAELAPLLSERGINPAEAFAGTGIDGLGLSPEMKLPFAGALRALNKAAELTHCPHLGLVLGQRFCLAHHGAIGQLMRCAPTLGRALLDFTSWQPGYSSGAVVYLHQLDEDYAFGYGATGMGSAILHDLVSAIGMRMVEELTGGAIRPEEIHLSHRQPPGKSAHARYLKVPVRFNEQRVCLVFSAAALETRLPAADHARHQDVLAELRTRLHPAGPDAASRTRQALRLSLQRGDPGMAGVADELGMHPRTLRRRLAQEETSFEALRDGVRFDMARELLDLTDLPVGEIGSALAYASPSIFTDAFRRWSGLSPLAFRRRNDTDRQASAEG